MRSLIDWEYYKERVGSSILKIVTIPAALQGCQNPFPKVQYPDWLKKKIKELTSVFKQKKLSDYISSSRFTNMFSAGGGLQNIEDIGKSKVRELTQKDKDILQKQKEKQEKEEEERKRIELEEQNPPAIEDDFDGWLKWQKRFWRKYRKQRKENPYVMTNQSGIISMMKNFEQTFLNSTFQILHIQKTLMPGILKLWLRLPNNLMYSINLKVLRKFYIHSKEEQSEFTKTIKTLPRDRGYKYKEYHLYQIEQDEDAFLSKIDDLMHYHLSSTEIDGVYETQVPLEYRVILDLGNCVKPRAHLIDKSQSALDRIYSVKELAATKYDKNRNPFIQNISKILVYYAHTHNKHFIGVWIPGNSFVSTYTVAPSSLDKDISDIKLKFKKTIEEENLSQEFSYDNFSYRHFKDINSVMKIVDDIIRDYKSKTKQAFLVIIHSLTPIERLSSYGLASINNDVPYILSTGTVEENMFPALDWVYFATGNFCCKCLQNSEWFDEKYSFSLYSGIPIGNLNNDTAVQIIDVLYSRALQNSNHLLWYSDTSLPDLGGNEDADFRRFYDSFDSNAEMSFPGFYRTYWFEIDVRLLWINSILQSDHIYEFDAIKNEKKINSKVKDDTRTLNKHNDDIESSETCINSFLKLRSVVGQWLEDVRKDDNMFADVLLSHLYRWLSSSESKLFDPQLFNFITHLMQKCFTELIKKFKHLGSNIIFSSFNKIIIETKKLEFNGAQNYFNFIKQSIMKEEIFKYIRMEVSQEWKILLFKDRFNYGGIKESSTGLVTCEFDLKNHLPEKVSNLFLTLIGEYILKTYQFTQEGRKKALNNDLQDNSTIQLTNISSEKLMNRDDEDPYIGQHSAITSSDLHQKLHDIGNENEIIEGRKWIQKEFTGKLFEIIDEINSEKSLADHQIIEAEKNAEDFSTEE